MKLGSMPYVAVLLAMLTLSYSMFVAFVVSGDVLGNVKITQLEPFGGVTFAHLMSLELWRLFASQLIHAKQVHMLYNVSCLALLGFSLRQWINNFSFLLLWFVSGTVGTLVSTLFVSPPWNLGTGASQAVLGLAAFGLVLVLKGIDSSKWLLLIVCLSLVPAIALDLIFAGYPKPGHIAGALIGVIAGVGYSSKICRKSEA